MPIGQESNILCEDRGPVRILRINRASQRNCVNAETAVDLGGAIEAFAGGRRDARLAPVGSCRTS
jgi:enoyl-CoA hydratase/carnithine racemase